MKYIRTKDGIYEIDETTILTSMPPCYKVIKPTDKYYAINEKSVIKQADTIEELCDFYVIWITNREYPILEIPQKGRRPNPSGLNLGECSFKEGYGAIKTEKGIIYVAKMNDKGELELL